MQVTDKVCVVTGAAAGIGRAIAPRFVTKGASALIAANISNRLDLTATEIDAAPSTGMSDPKPISGRSSSKPSDDLGQSTSLSQPRQFAAMPEAPR